MSRSKNQKLRKYKNRFLATFRHPSLHNRIKTSRFYGAVTLTAVIVASVTILESLSIQTLADSIQVESKSLPQWKLEQEARHITFGYPINPMLSYIFTKDEITAAYLIGIAKKESNWGKISPEKDGKDCYNYWGFKGKGSRGVAAGHTCFGSPEEAVDAVASRISSLVYDYNRTTPEELVVWKCGYSCHGHSAASVDKWIRDVAFYKDHLENAKN